jgi:two-component system response regulator NreC
LISQGFTDKQIAEKLKISIKTVESHKARIKEKLNMTHRSDLVQYVLRNGIKVEK